MAPSENDIFLWPDGSWQLRGEGLVHGSRCDFQTIWAGTQEWIDFAQAHPGFKCFGASRAH